MNYTIEETFELSGYTAVITADQNLAKLITDDFRMEVRDILTNEVTEIYRSLPLDNEDLTKHSLMEYGLNVPDNTPVDQWETLSCINNDGMYISFNGDTLTFKQIIPCSHEGRYIGCNSSEVNVKFNKYDTINFYSKTLPFFQRSYPYVLEDSEPQDDPILSAASARPDYNFDNYKDNERMSPCKTNFDYNSVGDLYVNNDQGHIKYYTSGNVTDIVPNITPHFSSNISAFYITNDQVGAITPYDFTEDNKGTHWSSTIWNEITDEESDIPVSKLNADPLSATIEFNSCSADVIYNVYRQDIMDSFFPIDYRKNVLKFYVDFENHGIHVTPISFLIIKITRTTGSPIIKVEITNPNVYDEGADHPLKNAPIKFTNTGSNFTYNNDANQVDNVLKYTLTADIDCGYELYVTAWLDQAIKGYSSDMVRQKSIMTVGPYDFAGASKTPYKPITIERVGCKGYNGNHPETYAAAESTYNSGLNVVDPLTGNLQLYEDASDGPKYGIIKYKITNPNAGPEWLETIGLTDEIQSECYPVARILAEDVIGNKIKIDHETTYFYVVQINCKVSEQEIYGNNTVDVFGYIEAPKPCAEDVYTLDYHDTTKWFFIEHENPKYQMNIYTCDEFTQGQYATNPCEKYTSRGNYGNTTSTTNHVLNVYKNQSGGIIDNQTEYGLQKFVIINQNEASQDEHIRITVYKTIDGTTHSLVIEGSIWEVLTRGHYENDYISVIDIQGTIYSSSVSGAVLFFKVVDIEPSTVWATFQIGDTTEDYNHGESTHIRWGEETFIPHGWEEFLDYVIFTKSKLDLDGAYIGVKSIYCKALKARNNTYIETTDGNGGTPGIFVNCQDNYDGNFVDLSSGVNAGGRYSNLDGDGITRNDASIPGSRSFQSMGLNLRRGSNNLMFNTQSKNRIYYTVAGMTQNNFYDHVVCDNPCYVGTLLSYMNMPDRDLPTFDIVYGGQNVNIGGGATASFNANGGIMDFGALNAGNNCTLELGPGEYHFTSMNADTNFKIRVNVNGAAGEFVRICVRDNCTFSNGFNLDNPNNDFMTFMLYCDGSGNAITMAASSDRYNYGVIVAPRGRVSFANTVYWNGAIWCDELVMANNCRFVRKAGT